MVDPNSFTSRFNLRVDLEDAKLRFVNRIRFKVYGEFLEEIKVYPRCPTRSRLSLQVAIALGEQANIDPQFSAIVPPGNDFGKNLLAVEAIREALMNWAATSHSGGVVMEGFDHTVQEMLSMAEVDLGIRWHEGKFHAAGAGELDEGLVDDNLRWLRADPRYETVRGPFEKGLNHFLKSRSDPARYQDVITDVYEALEALAKIVTRSDRELSKNREKFISVLELPAAYGRMLKEYIDYACDYRHAEGESNRRTAPAEREVEGFVYLTGLIIRLAIQPTQAD